MTIAVPLVIGGCADSGTSGMVQTSGTVSATLELSPVRPPPMDAVDLRLALSGAAGEPIAGAAVTFDATMPGMAMPEDRFEAREESAGIYAARTIFTMAGDWRLRVNVELPDGRREFVFDVATR